MWVEEEDVVVGSLVELKVEGNIRKISMKKNMSAELFVKVKA